MVDSREKLEYQYFALTIFILKVLFLLPLDNNNIIVWKWFFIGQISSTLNEHDRL